MGGTSFGILVLKSVPSVETVNKTVEFLARISKNTPRDNLARIVGNGRNGPVLLSEEISSENAEKIISSLDKLGASAVFLPSKRKIKPRTPQRPQPQDQPENIEKEIPDPLESKGAVVQPSP